MDEVGVGDGAGFTVNVPLESGAVDSDYRIAFDEIVLPVLRQFHPDLLLVSAGFDAHERDPLATMRADVRGVRRDDDGPAGEWRKTCAAAGWRS